MSRSVRKAVVIIIAVTVAGVVFLKVRQRAADPAITTSAPIAEAPVRESASAVPPSAVGNDSVLKRRLADEMRGRQLAEADAAALRAKTASLESNVVVSLGKVEDIGKRAGLFLPSLAALEALAGRDAGSLSPEERRQLLELQRDHAKLLGALPEIARFQDNPDEYGRFFSSMFQQAAGLTEPQAAQVQSYMRDRAVVMNQLELNAAKEPADPKLEEAWEERRDKFNEQTAEGLKGILPPGAAEKINFGPELMEFLEMDFDKLTPKPPEKKAP